MENIKSTKGWTNLLSIIAYLLSIFYYLSYRLNMIRAVMA
ncbi:hypothetical protein CWATWH0005_1994 [Crocosphaera watsonii WH 0005]|uniref:Uncharacterized protein n=1 Tax=Crocosphaera watsonii WH 0005 TaxID=423472 RepID=T2IXV3_CROWT|nr:hypothetical protein CWATWH0005_1994 [Crocosphaera watsonii WH 0005]